MATPDRTQAEKQTKGNDETNQIQKRKHPVNAKDTAL